MDYDYSKDNFDKMDKLLYDAARTYNRNLTGSVSDFAGCTTNEIKDIMHTTLKQIVPASDVESWLKKADLLVA